MNYFSDWTEEDIKKYYTRINKKPSKNDFNIKDDKLSTQNKKSKYRANKVEIDGIKFDSQKEGNYYNELKLRLQAKEIKGFCRQAEFILAPNLRYKADFIVFNNDGTAEIIDVKGFKTKVYKDKKKVFEDKFNLKIEEV
jgi:hypothetical protein